MTASGEPESDCGPSNENITFESRILAVATYESISRDAQTRTACPGLASRQSASITVACLPSPALKAVHRLGSGYSLRAHKCL